MKFRAILFIATLFTGSIVMGQPKLEGEHRIKKSQFPENSIFFMESKIGSVKKQRYYREIDSSAIYYTSKFKKDRLHYSIQFSENGLFQEVAIAVKEIDIPQDSWKNITSFLEQHITKYRIKRILQLYTVSEDQPEAITLKRAFQNLIIPELTYRIMAKGKTEGKCQGYRLIFDSEGSLAQIKMALPPNYDHILY